MECLFTCQGQVPNLELVPPTIRPSCLGNNGGIPHSVSAPKESDKI
jgi:hypothetical protein